VSPTRRAFTFHMGSNEAAFIGLTLHAALRNTERQFSGNTVQKNRREHCKTPRWRSWLGGSQPPWWRRKVDGYNNTSLVVESNSLFPQPLSMLSLVHLHVLHLHCVIHAFFTQSLSSLPKTCPYFFRCNNAMTSYISGLSLCKGLIGFCFIFVLLLALMHRWSVVTLRFLHVDAVCYGS